MKTYRITSSLLLIAAVTLTIVGCSKVPLTGRQQFSLIPESTLAQMSDSEYDAFLSKNKVIASGTDAQMVKTVGQRISQSVQTYLAQNKAADRVKGFKWEFNLVESKEQNAWCMPGGKVAVYTGLLPVTKDETGLAIVMGHEIAHAVAQHGNERMTQGLLQQLGAIGLAVALQSKPAQTQEMFMQAYGIGSQVAVLLPFSRKQESEADQLGLIFAAMAGYDPNQAIPFWERMAKIGGAAPPELLSTHPSNSTRIADLKKYMPQALKYYKKGSYTPSTTPTGGNTSGGAVTNGGSGGGRGTNTSGTTNTGGTRTTTPSRGSATGGAVKPSNATNSGSGTTTPDTRQKVKGKVKQPK
jgi:predicted Zn-dependent protease